MCDASSIAEGVWLILPILEFFCRAHESRVHRELPLHSSCTEVPNFVVTERWAALYTKVAENGNDGNSGFTFQFIAHQTPCNVIILTNNRCLVI